MDSTTTRARRPGRPRQSSLGAPGVKNSEDRAGVLPIPDPGRSFDSPYKDDTGSFSELVNARNARTDSAPPRRTPSERQRSRRHSGAKNAGTKARRPDRVTNRGKVRTQQRPRRGWLGGGVALSMKTIATIAVVAVTGVVAVPICLQWAEQRRQYEAVSTELENAQAQREHLEEQLKNWEDREFIAAQARSRLGYVEKGETQFSVADAPKTETGSQAVRNIIEPPPKPWVLLLQDSLLESDNPAPEVEGIDDARVLPRVGEENEDY